MKTREIRWFFKQTKPGIAEWLKGLEDDRVTRENRTDSYLFLPGRKDLGVKLRAGRLEIKHRTAPPWPKQIAPGWEGYLESWVKYGFELKDGNPDQHILTGADPTWLEIGKHRTAILINKTHSGLDYGPLRYENRTAVQLEYTKLQFFEQNWYTLGLEWPENLKMDLPESLFAALLGSGRLTRAESMGYAEFLQWINPSKDS